jgi:tRNA pseudouridine38-40 synthase
MKILHIITRTMVGTVMQVGTGHWQPNRIPEIIASKDRQQAGFCAPAQGLQLQWIGF